MGHSFPIDFPDAGYPGHQARAAYQLWREWRQGRQPAVEEFLAGAGELTPAQVAAVLRVDQRERWLLGERVPAEAYLEKFPPLQTAGEPALDLVYGEFLLREQLGEAPSPEEYEPRFPVLGAELRLQIEFHRAMADISAEYHRKATVLSANRKTPATGEAREPLPSLPGYEVMELLGRGGMGVVYKALQTGLKRLVALKMIAAPGQADAEQRERFRAEAEAVARLQHPNIVQVHEVGEHDGRAFFSMELVEGPSLEKRLGGAPLPARQAARIAEVLARAVHAAHQRGVVHRDLKPANVLVGRDADTPLEEGPLKITDFGLAKRLDAGPGQTRTGAVMGTPSYMAPEQAAGKTKEIGPAVDVYALGALLYELLTGRPPFKGGTVLETLEQVRNAEPVAPGRLRPGLPRDLETICLKCLEKEPGRRYPSAEALADELNRFLAGRPIRARRLGPLGRSWRWCKRQPVVAGLVTALLLALVGGIAGVVWQWQRAEANLKEVERQRDEAAAGFRLARRAVGRFCLEVSDSWLLNEPGMEGLRKNLLGAAVQFYGQLVELRRDSPEALADRAEAYLQLSILTDQLGSRKEALRLGEKALDLARAVHQKEPHSPEHVLALTRAYHNLGSLLDLDRRHEKALAFYQDEYKLLEGFAPAGGDSPDVHFARSLACSSLGWEYNLVGESDRAEAYLLQAIAGNEKLVRAHPGEERYQVALALSLFVWGGHCSELHRPGQGLAAAERAVHLQEELVRARPENLVAQLYLARFRCSLGSTYEALGKLAGARTELCQAARLLRRLVRAHPARNDLGKALALCLTKLGSVYQTTNQMTLAEHAYRQAEDIWKGLPAPPREREELNVQALNYRQLGVLYHTTGRPEQALARLRKAREIWDRLVREAPGARDYQLQLADCWQELGKLRADLGQSQQGEKDLLRARDLGAALVEKCPQLPGPRHRLAITYVYLGQLYGTDRRWPEAEAANRKALALWERLRKENYPPDNYLKYLYLVYHNLGHVCRATSRPQLAAEMFLQALPIEEQLVRAHPEEASYLSALAQTRNVLGSVYYLQGQRPRAEAVFQENRAALEKLLPGQPQAPWLVESLGEAYGNLAQLRWEARDPAQGRRHYSRALEVLTALQPATPTARKYLFQAYVGRARLLRAEGRLKEAVKDLENAVPWGEPAARNMLHLDLAMTLAFLGEHERATAAAGRVEGPLRTSGAGLYRLAWTHATCAAAASKDARLPPDQRTKVADGHAARAVAFLHQARKAGYFTDPGKRKFVLNQACFKALHSRQDFRDFIAGLEKEAQGAEGKSVGK